MPGVSAVLTDVRNEILRILKEDIAYEIQDGDNGSPIAQTAVVIQKTQARINREFATSNQEIDVPGLLLCGPKATRVPPDEGDNERDFWHYYFLVQCLDNDVWSNTDRLGTWDKWVEQIVSIFMFSCLNGVLVPPKGQGWCVATPVQSIDEHRWVKDGKFICGIEIEVKLLQQRGVIA